MGRSNNLPAKKYKAGERTERTLRFAWDAGNDGGTKYIDLAKSLSTLNRRAYRQGLYYYVSSAYFINGSTAHVQINTLPDTWMTKVAWARGYKKWSRMNREAANGSGSMIYPKYHDFKTQMVNGSTIMDCVNADLGGGSPTVVTYTSDDWVISKFCNFGPTY